MQAPQVAAAPPDAEVTLKAPLSSLRSGASLDAGTAPPVLARALLPPVVAEGLKSKFHRSSIEEAVPVFVADSGCGAVGRRHASAFGKKGARPSACVSLPAIAHRPSSSGGSCGSRHAADDTVGSKRRTHTPGKEEVPLPAAEALRQVLIGRAGSLRQAYEAMDVRRTGEVDLRDFELGLLDLRVYGSPLVEFADVHELFHALVREGAGGTLSLEDLLGYVPLEPQGHPDTRTMWLNYHNKASTHQSRLTRAPRWRALPGRPAMPNDQMPCVDRVLEGVPVRRCTDWAVAQSAHVQRRRDLRKIIREARDYIQMDEKRELVGGLVAVEERQAYLANEQRKVARSKHRIEGAIRDCSRARQELVGMQRKMVSVASGGDPNDSKRPAKAMRKALLVNSACRVFKKRIASVPALQSEEDGTTSSFPSADAPGSPAAAVSMLRAALAPPPRPAFA